MNVNENRTDGPSRMQEAPGTRPSGNAHSPSEVLAILRPTPEAPKPLRIGGLWKTGRDPQGAES